jgi:hypothetical protein
VSELRQTARIVGIGLLTVAAVDLAGNWLGERPLAGAMVQLAIAEFGAGRMAIAWSPPGAAEPSTTSIIKRALRGAGFGFGAALLALCFGLVSRTLSIRSGSFEPMTLLTGFLVAAMSAARDELLLRGIVIRALQNWTRGSLVLFACALAAIGRNWFADGATPQSAIVSGAFAVALACIWLVDRGAWMAVGANAAWLFAANVVFRMPISVRAADPPWGGGSLGIAGGRVSAIAMGLAAAAAVVWWRRERNRE